MITDNAGRLKAAHDLLRRFIEVGRMKDATRRANAQRSPAGWAVARDVLAKQVKERLDGKLPEQLETSYCGPAAFLYCLIHDRPDLYVTYALALWEHGRFRFGNQHSRISVGSGSAVSAAAKLIGTRAADPGARHINDLDWMTMSCLSASTRPVGFGELTPTDKLGSITYPWVLRKWFVAAGSSVREDTMGLGLIKSTMASTLNLMKHWGSSWLVLQIDSSLLKGGGTNTFEKRHWVVVDPHKRPMVRRSAGTPMVPLGDAVADVWKVAPDHIERGLQGTHMAEWATDLSVASWGRERWPVYSGKLGQAIGRIYGGYAFSRFK